MDASFFGAAFSHDAGTPSVLTGKCRLAQLMLLVGERGTLHN